MRAGLELMNCVTDSTQIRISGLTPGYLHTVLSRQGLMSGLMTGEMDGPRLCLRSAAG